MTASAETMRHAAAEAAVPTEEGLAAVADLVELQLGIETEVDRLESELKDQKEHLKRVSEDLLPAAMREHNLTDLRTASGLKVTVREIVRASIPKKFQTEAFAWLESEGHGDLIKHEVKSQFGRGEDEAADLAITLLRAQGFDVEDRRSVHTQTLGAFVREQIADGAPVPHDLLGVYVGQKAKIERP